MTKVETEPGERYWKLVEPHWERVSIYDGPEVFLRDFERAPVAARHLLAAHWCQSEVCNGGFSQFFWNGTGVLAPEAVEAFDAIGMPKLAALVRRAMVFCGSTYVRDREQRVALLEHYEQRQPKSTRPFDEMNEQFYQLLREEAGGWDRAADAYAERHGG